MRIATIATLLVSLHGFAHAETKISSQGELGVESRVFFPDGDGDPANVAGVGRLTIDLKNKPFKARLRGFMRHDGIDRQRSALFPEEAWLEFKKSGFRLRAGYQLLNWTATEAFHPADIINSRYLDGNVQSPEKLGELMLSLRYKFLDGNAEAFFMPLFTAPILPSSNSRFRFSPKGAVLGDSVVLNQQGELSDEVFQPQWGLRIQQLIAGADVSLHVVQQIDRSLPLILFDPNNQSAPPDVAFQHVTQVGGTYQQPIGSLIAKVEGAYRWFTEPDNVNLPSIPNYGTIAAGLEWGRGHDSGGESTILLEGQNVFGLDDSNTASFLLFQRDVLLGYRYAHGDENDQTVTSSVIVDLSDPEKIFGNAEYSRRLGETWRVNTGLRLIWFPPEDPDNPIGPENLHKANYAYANLTRYF